MKAEPLSIDEIKARLTIPDVWRMLQLPGEPGKSCAAPTRPDKKPSFSVFDDGRRWKDHASGEGGDVLDFIAQAMKCGNAEAIQWAREQCGGAMPSRAPVAHGPTKDAKPKPPPTVRPGTEAELEDLSERRGFDLATLHDAQLRGLLGFANVFGKVAWCVRDPGGRIMEGRRLDGELWEAFGSMPARKVHAWGHGKTWPVNLDAAAKLPKLALCEGGPDLLAALEIVRREGKAESVGVVAMLGAANSRFDAEALPLFRGKIVRIFCHADGAGRKAAKAWARALVDADAGRVDAFDLSGLVRLDGLPGKDLADLLNIAPDCRAQWRKFNEEVMP